MQEFRTRIEEKQKREGVIIAVLGGWTYIRHYW